MLVCEIWYLGPLLFVSDVECMIRVSQLLARPDILLFVFVIEGGEKNGAQGSRPDYHFKILKEM
jgi:hypothetical protein